MNTSKKPLDPQRVYEQVEADLLRDEANEAYGREAPTIADLAPSFPAYQIHSLIGQGGMGAVFRAHHAQLDRDVALKVLPAQLAEDPAFEERFIREAKALARLDHPHIIRVFDFGKTNEWFYLVTEYVDGLNLRQVMQMGKTPPAESLRIVPQVCDALHFAHQQGVVHRDIKPENILVDQDGKVKIADFGLAKLVGDAAADALHLTETRQVLGTPHYIAPEQMTSPTEVDHRADIFSLGVVFYEMLTGQLPIGRFAPPSEHGESPAQLDSVVMRSLEHEPKRRYQSVEAMRSDVVRSESQTAAPLPPAPDVPSQNEDRPTPRPTRLGLLSNLKILLALVCLVLSILAISVGISTHERDLILYLGLPLFAAVPTLGFGVLWDAKQVRAKGIGYWVALFVAWIPALVIANAAILVTSFILLDHFARDEVGHVPAAALNGVAGALLLADLGLVSWFVLRRIVAGQTRKPPVKTSRFDRFGQVAEDVSEREKARNRKSEPGRRPWSRRR